MWAEKDSNLRTRERTDLQSVAFSHSAIYPLKIRKQKLKVKNLVTKKFFCDFNFCFLISNFSEPLAGIEPATY